MNVAYQNPFLLKRIAAERRSERNHNLFVFAILVASFGLALAGMVRGKSFATANLKSAPEKTMVGTVRNLGAGKIRSWVKTSNGKLTAIGVTFDENALKDLPAEPPPGSEGHEYLLALPSQAGESVFKQIGINWNPHGHVPAKIYDVGHFDFHFYAIPEDVRNGITATADDNVKAYKAIPADEMPAGHIIAPESAIAKMGAHIVNTASHEFHGAAFTKTFLFGAYDGRIVFLEPMITRAYLESKPNVVAEIPLTEKLRKTGQYPTRWSIQFDEKTREYTVALEGI